MMRPAIRTAAALTIFSLVSPAIAGLDTIEIEFALEFEVETLGLVSLSQTFEAVESDEGGTVVLIFGGDGSFDVEAPGATMAYTGFSALYDGEYINGSSMVIIADGGTSLSYDFDLTGIGELWDGTFASGTAGVYLNRNGFVPDYSPATWSISLVPTPGAVALLAVAGLTGHRRRR